MIYTYNYIYIYICIERERYNIYNIRCAESTDAAASWPKELAKARRAP